MAQKNEKKARISVNKLVQRNFQAATGRYPSGIPYLFHITHHPNILPTIIIHPLKSLRQKLTLKKNWENFTNALSVPYPQHPKNITQLSLALLLTSRI